jgi:hypothetical protein
MTQRAEVRGAVAHPGRAKAGSHPLPRQHEVRHSPATCGPAPTPHVTTRAPEPPAPKLPPPPPEHQAPRSNPLPEQVAVRRKECGRGLGLLVGVAHDLDALGLFTRTQQGVHLVEGKGEWVVG